MSKVFWAIRISRCISLSLSLSLSPSLHTDMNKRILMGYWSQGEKMHQKGLLSLSLPHLPTYPPIYSPTYPSVYTLNLHQGNVNDNQWGYCNPPSRLFPLPSTFLPTSPSGRYLPNLTYLSALTCLVIVPTNPLTIKRTMLEEIKWGYWKKICFLKGWLKIFANTFHGDIACNHLRWGYCIWGLGVEIVFMVVFTNIASSKQNWSKVQYMDAGIAWWNKMRVLCLVISYKSTFILIQLMHIVQMKAQMGFFKFFLIICT